MYESQVLPWTLWRVVTWNTHCGRKESFEMNVLQGFLIDNILKMYGESDVRRVHQGIIARMKRELSMKSKKSEGLAFRVKESTREKMFISH